MFTRKQALDMYFSNSDCEKKHVYTGTIVIIESTVLFMPVSLNGAAIFLFQQQPHATCKTTSMSKDTLCSGTVEGHQHLWLILFFLRVLRKQSLCCAFFLSTLVFTSQVTSYLIWIPRNRKTVTLSTQSQFACQSVGDDGVQGRAVIIKRSQVWVPCCSRWLKVVWRAVTTASSVDLPALYANHVGQSWLEEMKGCDF